MVAKTLASRSGGRPAIVVGDVSAKDGPAQIAAEALRALGGCIDILVNNAGASRPITDEVDDAYWEESLTLNFMAARRSSRLVKAPSPTSFMLMIPMPSERTFFTCETTSVTLPAPLVL